MKVSRVRQMIIIVAFGGALGFVLGEVLYQYLLPIVNSTNTDWSKATDRAFTGILAIAITSGLMLWRLPPDDDGENK